MKDIQVIKGKFYIHRLIEEGEHEQQDFKYAISDARKIARSISAFANNSGGRLLVGVKDNGNIIGVPNEEDIYMLEHAAEAYCYPPQPIEISAFAVDGGAVVLRATIQKAAERPVFCIEQAKKLVAYYRVHDENIVAHELMVEAWKMQSEASAPVSLSDGDYNFLHFLEQAGHTTLEEYALVAHISAKAARSVITRLLATGIIEMFHTSSGFRIRHTE